VPGDLARKVGVSLSPGGPLARAMRGFEARPGQLRMALAWAEALETPRVLVAEAATGIGKTLAYLVPSILSGRKTIVSTGTRVKRSPTSFRRSSPAGRRSSPPARAPSSSN